MPVAIPRSVRPVFFYILDLDINDHTIVSQTRSVVWSLMSYAEKGTEKKPGLWDRGMVTGRRGEKPEHRRPLSIKTSHYWWRKDAGVKIVTFRIAANTMARNGRGQIQLFNVWRRRQKKKAEFTPFHSAPSYLRQSGRQQFYLVHQ